VPIFDLERFISDCQQAVERPVPSAVVKKLVQDAVADPRGLKAAIASRSGHGSLRDAVLFRSETLTVLPAVTSPGLRTPAHDHQMWAVIGVIDGEEPNDFFVDGEEGLQYKSSRVLRQGDVAVLDGNTIHAISNPLSVNCHAIHVYGGDLVTRQGRSMWNPFTKAREPYDIDRLSAYIREMRVQPGTPVG